MTGSAFLTGLCVGLAAGLIATHARIFRILDEIVELRRAVRDVTANLQFLEPESDASADYGRLNEYRRLWVVGDK